MSSARSFSAASFRLSLAFAVLGAMAFCVAARAQDANVLYPIPTIERRLAETPLDVLQMEQARPRIEDDRSIRVVLEAEDGTAATITAKLKPVADGGSGFNNEPRYELAAYRLQKLFLDEDEYVVPPVVLRSEPLETYRALQPQAEPTFPGTSSMLYLLAYWLEQVTNRDPFDEELFETDLDYARHWGNANVLTYLIRHSDGNIGNMLVSMAPGPRRVFSVDNDVAFRSGVSRHGDPWSRLRVERLPAGTIERLRALTERDLERALGVVAEFEIVDGHLLSVDLGPNLDPRRGVRTTDTRVQFGLASVEISGVQRRIERLLRNADRGRIETF